MLKLHRAHSRESTPLVANSDIDKTTPGCPINIKSTISIHIDCSSTAEPVFEVVYIFRCLLIYLPCN